MGGGFSELADMFLRGGRMDLFADATIRMVVAFVAGEPARRLLPLSQRFVPEPVQMSYIVTDSRMGTAAFLPRDIMKGWVPRVRRADIHRGERICSICVSGEAGNLFVPVCQFTLQTRLRSSTIPNSEAFQAFILRYRIELVGMMACTKCYNTLLLLGGCCRFV